MKLKVTNRFRNILCQVCTKSSLPVLFKWRKKIVLWKKQIFNFYVISITICNVFEIYLLAIDYYEISFDLETKHFNAKFFSMCCKLAKRLFAQAQGVICGGSLPSSVQSFFFEWKKFKRRHVLSYTILYAFKVRNVRQTPNKMWLQLHSCFCRINQTMRNPIFILIPYCLTC